MSLSNTLARIDSDYATDTSTSSDNDNSLYNGLENDLRSFNSLSMNNDQVDVPAGLSAMPETTLTVVDSVNSVDSVSRVRDATTINDSTARIDWNRFRDNATGAYGYAIQTNRPLVLVIGEDWCTHCNDLERELRDPSLSQFSGDAVFAYVRPSRDPAAAALAQRLGLTAYPTISILEPNAQMVDERARLNGFFTASQLQGHFRDFLRRPSEPSTSRNAPVSRPVS